MICGSRPPDAHLTIRLEHDDLITRMDPDAVTDRLRSDGSAPLDI